MPNPFYGKTIFFHNIPAIFGGNYPKIIEWLKANSFVSVLAKAADGAHEFKQWDKVARMWYPNLTAAFVETCHDNGIQVIGWGFNYGFDPEGEGKIAAQLCDKLKLDGWAFDVESKFESFPDAVGRAGKMIGKYNQTIIRNVPLAFCSWALYWNRSTGKQMHKPEIGRFLMGYCDAIIPMVYWNKLNWFGWPVQMTNAEVLSYCADSLKQQVKITSKPIVPALRAYTGDAGFANGKNIIAAGDFARDNCRGASWWFADQAHKNAVISDALWATPGWDITDNEPPDDDTPPVEPPLVPAIPGPYYLLSDAELGIPWSERFAGAKLKAYPATINLIGGSGTVQLSTAWQSALRSIMTLAQWLEIWKDEHGWHNRPHYSEIGKYNVGDVGRVQQVTFAHSKVWVTGIRADGRYEIDAYYNDETPPDLRKFDPYRNNTFSVMDDQGNIFYSDKGMLPVLVIANNRTEKLRIDKMYCKPLAYLPLKAHVKTGGDNLNVRAAPSVGAVYTTLKNGTPVTVFELWKVGNGAWGRITEPGSIAGWVAMWYTDW